MSPHPLASLCAFLRQTTFQADGSSASIRVHPQLRALATLAFVFLFCLPSLPAQTLDDLIAQDHLRITSRLEPTEPVIATQRARLVIEIATDTWFSGGTKLGTLEVRNAIALQRQTFGVNSTRREGGKTWAVQSWSIEIYPLFPGTYEVPAVSVDLAVSSSTGAAVQGQTFTTPTTVEAIAPPIPPPTDLWIVAPSLSVNASWNQPIEDLKVGDARNYTLSINTTELPSMVLPTPPVPNIEGLGVYPQPAQRIDENSRGAAVAGLTQTVSYFCEQAGDYTLPGFSLSRWDIAKGEWEVISIPETSFTVAVDPNALTSTEGATDADAIARPALKRILLIATVAGLLGWLGWWLSPVMKRGYTGLKRRIIVQPGSEKDDWNNLKNAAVDNDASTIATALYRWTRHLDTASSHQRLCDCFPASLQPQLEPLLSTLFDNAYGKTPGTFPDGAKLLRLLEKTRKIHRVEKMKIIGVWFDERTISENQPSSKRSLNFPASTYGNNS